MPQKPASWTPPDGTIGQVPIAVTQDVDTAGVDPASAANAHTLAERIVRDNQPAINRFVKVQRQQIEIGQEAVHRSMLPLDKMEVYYQYVAPFERMHYHISPQFYEPPAVSSEVSEPPAPAEPIIPPEAKVPELEVKVPEPEIPKAPEPPKIPEPPEEPKEEKEEEKKKEFGKPDFLEIDIPYGLAVQFGDGAGDP